MRRPALVNVVAVVLVLGLVAVYLGRPEAPITPEPEKASEVLKDAKAPLLQAPSSSGSVKPDITPPKAKAVIPPVAFEYQNELNQYAALQAKVLPSPDERDKKQALLINPKLLMGMAVRLVRLPLLPLGEQGAAIDLLLDAVKSGDREAAETALAVVVEDKQVEDPSLMGGVREQLAGIKAEVLYHWAALVPSQVPQIPKRLPGPASRKIWDNVREAHSDNEAESRGK
ncbi:MAG TPA: hypothetical protein PKC28_06305 [Bdellovibrionales bacterium]|nr:hypothetical protein [Bdellovibrionales bacterium]